MQVEVVSLSTRDGQVLPDSHISMDIIPSKMAAWCWSIS